MTSARIENTLPISVVMPIKDSRRLLKYHLARNQDWLPLVQEIIVVDSYSKDGSLDFLRRHLHHTKVRFLQHPPQDSGPLGITASSMPRTSTLTSLQPEIPFLQRDSTIF